MEDEVSINQNTGLSKEQVLLSAKNSGTNKLNFKKENSIVHSLKSLLKEPMILLLLLASTIYFITGDQANGIFLLSAILLVSFISLYQESNVFFLYSSNLNSGTNSSKSDLYKI